MNSIACQPPRKVVEFVLAAVLATDTTGGRAAHAAVAVVLIVATAMDVGRHSK